MPDNRRILVVNPNTSEDVTAAYLKVARAREFIAGEAAVEPQKGACDYCDLGPLCRVGLEVELPA